MEKFSLITFLDVPEDGYRVSEQTGYDVITCDYVIDSKLVPTSQDWVGLFPVGWKSLTECLLKRLIVLPRGFNPGQHSQLKAALHMNVRDILNDRATTEPGFMALRYFQFCYVTMDCHVRGVSQPFRLWSTSLESAERLEEDSLCSEFKRTEDITSQLKRQVQDMIIDVLIQKQQDELLANMGEADCLDYIGGYSPGDKRSCDDWKATLSTCQQLLQQLYRSSTMFELSESSRARVRTVLQLLDSVQQSVSRQEPGPVMHKDTEDLLSHEVQDMRKNTLCETDSDHQWDSNREEFIRKESVRISTAEQQQQQQQLQQEIFELRSALYLSRAESESLRRDLDLITENFKEYKVKNEGILRAMRPLSESGDVCGRNTLAPQRSKKELPNQKGELVDISLPFFYSTGLNSNAIKPRNSFCSNGSRNSLANNYDETENEISNNCATDKLSDSRQRTYSLHENVSEKDVRIAYMTDDEVTDDCDWRNSSFIPGNGVSKGCSNSCSSNYSSTTDRVIAEVTGSKTASAEPPPLPKKPVLRAPNILQKSRPVTMPEAVELKSVSPRGSSAGNGTFTHEPKISGRATDSKTKPKAKTLESYFKKVDERTKTQTVTRPVSSSVSSCSSNNSNSYGDQRVGSKCPMCEIWFSGRASVREINDHIKRHYETSRICPHCRKLFKTDVTDREYREHIKSHQNIRTQ